MAAIDKYPGNLFVEVSDVLSPRLLALIFALVGCALNYAVQAQEASRTIPSRVVPVPDSVSPELQKVLAQPVEAAMPPPKTTEEWKALSEQSGSSEQAGAQELAKLRERFAVTVVPKILGGVRCYEVTPKFISFRNRHRLILNLHHRGFIWGGGESGTEWAIELAGLMGYRVLVVDYRLLPDHPFPAALDDAISVWREITKTTKSSNIAVLGGSAGGGLVLSLIQKARSEHLPMPGAVVSISPGAADLSKTGDSYYTNDGVDGTVSYDGFWEAAFKLYANGRDLKDPLVSPLYGDFSGFPPTYLITGTRDLFLSDTVRVQRKLLQAGVSMQLEVLEGLPHPGFLMVDIPEIRDMYSHVAQFIDAHLGR